MSLAETAVAKFPSGSGRSMDWLYPTQDANRANGTNILNIQSRLTGDVTTQALGTILDVAATFAVRNGVPCVQVATNGVNGGAFGSDNVWALKAILTKGHPIPPGYNFYACWRYAATMAFDTVPAAGFDYGFEVVFALNGTFPLILKNNVGGFGFCRRPGGGVSLLIQGAGLNEFPINTPGFDPTVFHQYELRVISATKTQEATFRAFVDGVPFQAFSWGVGTILPAYNPNYPQAFAAMCNAAPAVGPKLFVYDVEVSASATEAGLL